MQPIYDLENISVVWLSVRYRGVWAVAAGVQDKIVIWDEGYLGQGRGQARARAQVVMVVVTCVV